MSRKKNKFHYFYKITNLINGHFYYGVHNTNDLDDGYMGSGTRLSRAFKKYGMENFKKEILKFFNTSEEAFSYESEIVTEELVRDCDCYNVSTGGNYGWKTTKNTAIVKNTDGIVFRVPLDDIRLKNGELVGITKGYVRAKDECGNSIWTRCDDDRFESGEIKHWSDGMTAAMDKSGRKYYVSVDDPRLKTGEIFGCTKGIRFSEEYRNKMSQIIRERDRTKGRSKKKMCYVCNDTEVIKINTVDKEKYLEIGYQPGKKYKPVKNARMSELYKQKRWQDGERNSNYGNVWIYNETIRISKRIKKEYLETYLSEGWKKGRKMKFD